jgi:energy-converting hydrogenase B subunit D
VIPLQVAAILIVAAAGTAVVLVRDPLRQLIVNGFFGLGLIVLFIVFQAPDVSLSAIAVGGFALPVMVLLALAQLHRGDDE